MNQMFQHWYLYVPWSTGLLSLLVTFVVVLVAAGSRLIEWWRDRRSGEKYEDYLFVPKCDPTVMLLIRYRRPNGRNSSATSSKTA